MKRLEDLLKTSKDNGLNEVIEHARDMGDLVQILQQAIPEQQRGAISAANIREDGELVILASSSAWASRLRFETDTLLAAVKDSGKTARRCSVRVARG